MLILRYPNGRVRIRDRNGKLLHDSDAPKT